MVKHQPEDGFVRACVCLQIAAVISCENGARSNTTKMAFTQTATIYACLGRYQRTRQ